MPEPVRVLPCPTCRKSVRWASTNKYRPFCSERCRLIDFGDWAEERHRIPGQQLEDVMSDDLEQTAESTVPPSIRR